MSTHASIQAHGKKIDLLGQEVLQSLEGGRDVIIAFESSVSEDRIIKAIHAVIGKYEVQLEVRHAELRDYLTHALAGAGVGAGLAVTGLALAVKAGAVVLSAPVALATLGIGALIGGAAGAAMAPVSRIVVYKYRSETRVKFISKNLA